MLDAGPGLTLAARLALAPQILAFKLALLKWRLALRLLEGR